MAVGYGVIKLVAYKYERCNVGAVGRAGRGEDCRCRCGAEAAGRDARLTGRRDACRYYGDACGYGADACRYADQPGEVFEGLRMSRGGPGAGLAYEAGGTGAAGIPGA